MTARLFAEVKVHVESVETAHDITAPDDRPHAFRYQILITNESQEPIKFIGRKWVLRGISGRCDIIEGDGIVGKNPTLAPSQEFRYQSFHVVAETTNVCGSYFGVTKSGEHIYVPVPDFELIIE